MRRRSPSSRRSTAKLAPSANVEPLSTTLVVTDSLAIERVAAPQPTPVLPYLQDPGAAPALAFLYRPHTATGAAIALGVALYGGFMAPPGSGSDDDEAAATRRGLFTVAACFLVYCSIQLRDSLLLRPHPIVWRIVHGASLLYLLGLGFLLALPPSAARAALKLLDPALTGPRPAENDRIYATDCRIWTPGDPGGPFARVSEVVFDIFVVAHTLGWMGKALLLRDLRLSWALSLLWEVLEISLQGVLPNFHECWWDHWIVDVALSNGIGLVVGTVIARALQMRRFDWSGLRRRRGPASANGDGVAIAAAGGTRRLPVPAAEIVSGSQTAASIPSPSRRRVARGPATAAAVAAVAAVAGPAPDPGVASLLLGQLAPYDFASYEWRLFEGPQHLFAALALVVLMEVVELNAFFLKFVLHVPPPSPLNAMRLALWFGLALPAVHEYYHYDTDEGARRMGPNLWLALTAAGAEVLLIVKVARETDFPGAHVPDVVVACWSVALAALVAWSVIRFLPLGPTRWASARSVTLNTLVCVGVGALAFLAWHEDVGYGAAVKSD